MRNNPLRHYCTHFDRNYLLKGIALYRSLERHAGAFVLHVVCLDDTTYELLERLRFGNVRLIRRADFEDPALLAVKPTRTVAEYCWTCTPSVPLYVLGRDPAIDLITYLDADLYFFSSPEPIFEELADRSILLIEHRFAPRYAEYEVNGRFNVGWLSFRRDEDGMAALRWWRDKCIEWCFYRLEDERMGDQKYLDKWPTQFRGVHVLQNVGANVAPYNFSQYKITNDGGSIRVDGVPLIFYHFHGFRYLADGRFIPIAEMYLQDAELPRAIYEAYQQANQAALRLVRRLISDFTFGLDPVPGVTNPAEPALKLYWQVPDLCRSVFRRIVPRQLRAKVRRALGIATAGDER